VTGSEVGTTSLATGSPKQAVIATSRWRRGAWSPLVWGEAVELLFWSLEGAPVKTSSFQKTK